MAIRTVDELGDRLDGALGWRRIELQTLKSQIRSAYKNSPHSPLTRALSRSGVALLYAHWEGYVKEACQAYVDHVAKRRLKVGELNDGFLKVVLDQLNKRSAAGDQAASLALMEAVRQPENARARIPKDSIVDTKSNLSSAVLADIMNCVGFDSIDFSTKNNLIDKTLCNGRNAIAHGRDYYPSPPEFDSLHDDVLGMLEDIRDLIMTHARDKKYMRVVA
ncbi:MAE_28990/MAE_18760 family HEPN-like nuclease [Streptomyces sp. NPDC005859]|uniref:MAE_28990/MAE_18760 family HEPN-like nuclease n=1 Tax=Streptomyces sp. NPDC005859 TaxID=3157170 RepID=UPI0034102BD9